MGTHTIATTAVVTSKVFDVLMTVSSDVVEAVAVEVVDAAAKTLPATTAGAAGAPMAAAMAIVKTAVGFVRVNTVSTRPDMRSRNISRPRASRCFTASSLIANASATAATD